MYPAYPPYQMPMYAPPRPKTPQGLRWVMVGFSLLLGYFLASATAGAVLAGVLAGPVPTAADDVFSVIAITLAAGAITGILGILVLIFYWIGFGYLYSGRNEFGPTHARNLRVALVLLILAMSLGFAQFITVSIIYGQALRFTFGSFEVNPGMYYLGAAVNAILGIVVAALVAAHVVLCVRALAPPKREIVLYASAALGTATPGVTGALALLQMVRYIGYMEASAEALVGSFGFGTAPGLDPGSGIPAIIGGVLGVIAFSLFFWVVWESAQRIRRGELKPILPEPAPVVPYVPMVPAYPWPYVAYPAPPPAPAPGPPPTQPDAPPPS